MKRPILTRRRKKQLIPPSWRLWLEKRWQLLRGQWWFHLGAFALWRGRYQKAAQWLEKALALLGENAFLRMQLAWAHWDLGHPVTARFHALRATEQMPSHAPAWVFAGKVLALRGKWSEAERALRQALLLAPDNFVAGSWLALVLFQTQRPQEALNLLRRLPVVDEVHAYRTVPNELPEEYLRAVLKEPIHVVTFTSPSAVNAFFAVLGEERARHLLTTAAIACIGPVTEQAIRQRGFEPSVVSEVHTVKGLVEAITDWARAKVR